MECDLRVVTWAKVAPIEAWCNAHPYLPPLFPAVARRDNYFLRHSAWVRNVSLAFQSAKSDMESGSQRQPQPTAVAAATPRKSGQPLQRALQRIKLAQTGARVGGSSS